MKLSNKIHPVTSILTAVIMLVVLVISAITNVASLLGNPGADSNPSYVITTVVNLVVYTLTSILIVVALFRGKKDTVSGVLFILTALVLAWTGVISGIISLFSNISMGVAGVSLPDNYLACAVVASIIGVIVALIGVVFRVAIALECFTPGKLSGNKKKSILIILPIVNLILSAIATVVRQIYMVSEYDIGTFLAVALLPAVLGAVFSAWTVLLGLSISIPVWEVDPLLYMGQYADADRVME